MKEILVEKMEINLDTDKYDLSANTVSAGRS